MRNDVTALRRSQSRTGGIRPGVADQNTTSIIARGHLPRFSSDEPSHDWRGPGFSPGSTNGERTQGRKTDTILLPVDLTRCPIEAFEIANRMAKRTEVAVVLLHVVHLNLFAVENRVYEELGREAYGHLHRLAEEFLHPNAARLLRVRIGKPAEEILAEAKSANVDLILLPTFGPSIWTRVASVWRPAAIPVVSRLAAKIIREAGCGVFVVPTKSRLNCGQARGRPVAETPLPALLPSGFS